MSDLYEVKLRDTPEGVQLFWEIKKDRQVWRGLREGAYMLRTNLQAGSAEQLWSQYEFARTVGWRSMPRNRQRHVARRAGHSL